MEGGEITPPSSSHRSFSATPQSCCSEDDADGDFNPQSKAGGQLTDWMEIEKHEALRELQQMVNRYNECSRLLKDTVTTVELLRLENLQLTAENLELEFLIEDEEMAERARAVVIGLSTGVRSARVEEKGEKKVAGGGKIGSDFESPGGSGSASGFGSGSGVESGSGSGSGSGSDGARGGKVPKSISIRSRGFLALNQPPPGEVHRLRLPASPALNLQGGDKESGEVEVEVYNQGTAKTELCNKWGQQGWCPYEDRCQFAHGIHELRPVIRHPRYKTQLCRMMGSGGDCPYGHRCHFRHALPTPPK